MSRMRRLPFRWLALLVSSGLLALAGASCSDTAEPPTPIPCDIRDARCRSAIFTLTAQMRGQSHAKIPPTRIITRAQYATETRADVMPSAADRNDQVRDAAFRLLHFLGSGTSLSDALADSSIADVVAYYHEKTITIIDDAADEQSSGSLTLSHEYTHALQDQREGFDNLDQTVHSTDQVMALHALLEGEATILSDATMTRAANLEYKRDDVLAFMSRLLNRLVMNIAQSDAPFNEAELTLPYPVGGLPVANAYLASGSAGVQAFFQTRPSSLIGWVQLGRGTDTALPLPLSCDLPDAPAGYTRTAYDRLGGTGLIALYTRLGLDGSAAFEAAAAWTSDSFTVFAPTDVTAIGAAFVWRIGFTDEAAAMTLERLLMAGSLPLSVVRQRNEVVLSGATDPAVLTAWTVRNDCSTAKARAEPSPVLPPLVRYRR